MSFDLRFGGIARLYGQKALEKFQQSHICVIGIGGVGSWIAESLARSGIGRVTLIDPDEVSETNINRQLVALTPGNYWSRQSRSSESANRSN